MHEIHPGDPRHPFCVKSGVSACVHENSEVEETQARLHYLLQQNRALGLVVGEHGSGKSFQMERFAEQQKREGRLARHFSIAAMDGVEVLHEVAETLGVACPADTRMSRIWRRMTDRLAACRYENRRMVMLLDDADMADAGALSQLHRLLLVRESTDVRLTMVLGVHPEKLHRIGRRLLELVDLRIDMASWSVEDTQRHLQEAALSAGSEGPVFRQDAILRLHQLGHGVPRFINRLADLAMVAGAGRELSEIDGETVDIVSRELGTWED